MVQVSGISLHVEDHGSGRPVLLLHGWPDSAYLWRNQIPFLVNNGFHAIAPDLRGFGRSDRPEGVPAYSLQYVVRDVVGILDGLGIGAADIVGHDWALFREMLRGNGDVDRYISDLSRPGALTASLNWYRANLVPRAPGSSPQLPPVEAPTLGIWSTNDHYLDGEVASMRSRQVVDLPLVLLPPPSSSMRLSRCGARKSLRPKLAMTRCLERPFSQ